MDWHHPSQFPHPVRQWFKGQKDVLFYYGTVSSSTDIEIAFNKCSELQQNYASQQGKKEQKKDCQLQGMLLQLMLMQKKKLDSVTSSNEDLVFNRIDGSTVDAVCPCGSYEVTDTKPRFSCAQPGAYVFTEKAGCHKPECKANKRDHREMKPVSKQFNQYEITKIQSPSYKSKSDRGPVSCSPTTTRPSSSNSGQPVVLSMQKEN